VRSQSPTVRLELESRPQVLTIVRGMLAGVAEPLMIDAELLDDVKTAVSEACNNVVLHAYGGDAGPMDITVFAGADVIRVAVTDRGVGMTASDADPGTGIGLSVIRALAETVTIGRGPEGGTSVEMEFAAVRQGQVLLHPPDPPAPDHGWPASAADEVALSVSPIALLASVLGRMARTLAATAHFSLDRFSDVYLVTDALAAHATEAALDGRIDARLCAGERRLELEVGPFRTGASDRLITPAPGTRSPLALLSDEVRIDPGDGGDRVRVVIADRRQ
jgi:serine/threonine-protein kinase RsbW